jgi:hypothetical protein
MAIPHVFVAADMCVNVAAGRYLATNVRADSAIQLLGRTPQYVEWTIGGVRILYLNKE